MTMLYASQEALLVGKTLSRVCRARLDPQHPARGPQAVRDGRRVKVPEDAVRAYWATVPPRPGPPLTRPHRVAGVTLRQWQALARVAAGKPGGGVTVLRRLRDRGLIDDAGLTPEGVRVVARVDPGLITGRGAKMDEPTERTEPPA